MMMNKAVFLDKDGTLIPDIPYNVNPDLITLSDDALEGLKELKQRGYLLIVISNQAGVARGYFREGELQVVHQRLDALLGKEGLSLDAFYYCPHHPDGSVEEFAIGCDCRKPQPGMFFKASVDWNIDLSQSWMIGDILNDMEAGKLAGCKTILIDNKNETEWMLNEMRTPDYSVKTINEAARCILESKKAIEDHEYGIP